MACGCAFIGLDHPMYKDIGLVPGDNYIVYDGTLDGLRDVVREYQRRPHDLERIAQSGHRFVHEQLSPSIVAEAFRAALSDLVQGARR
jgi:hypothetical protein